MSDLSWHESTNTESTLSHGFTHDRMEQAPLRPTSGKALPQTSSSHRRSTSTGFSPGALPSMSQQLATALPVPTSTLAPLRNQRSLSRENSSAALSILVNGPVHGTHAVWTDHAANYNVICVCEQYYMQLYKQFRKRTANELVYYVNAQLQALLSVPPYPLPLLRLPDEQHLLLILNLRNNGSILILGVCPQQPRALEIAVRRQDKQS